MKVFGVIVILVVGALADEGYPASGWKPQGALLVLPQQYGPPQNNGTPPQPALDGADLEKVNEGVMQRLRQEAGSDTGVYYVYLPDGRLQRVQYTTAPLKAAPSTTTSQSAYQNNQQSNFQAAFGPQQVNSQANAQSFGKFQQETSYSQFQNEYQQQYQEEAPEQSEQAGDPSHILAQYNAKPEQPAQDQAPAKQKAQPSPKNSNYVASVQFTDVPPISGPIYNYNPAPLVRVLRYAPMFQ